MVDKLRIAFKNVNLEIIAKILDPMARKYGCGVRYTARDNGLIFDGDQNCFRPIVEEMAASLFGQPVPAPVRIDPSLNRKS